VGTTKDGERNCVIAEFGFEKLMEYTARLFEG
jgi:hypothetical protein